MRVVSEKVRRVFLKLGTMSEKIQRVFPSLGVVFDERGSELSIFESSRRRGTMRVPELGSSRRRPTVSVPELGNCHRRPTVSTRIIL